MNINLNGKSVALGVTGSISIYKACEVARLFIKAGANVHVIMTSSAKKFINPLTFEALTRNPVLCDESESWASTHNHIDMAKKCDILLIAPATANTLNKLSKGIADNILLQVALAFKGTILVAPSANTQMLQNHLTNGSLKMLRVNDVRIIASQNKLLACGDEGNGALAEPLEIFYHGAKALLEEEFWIDRKVVVTGGGTREKIDEVRYLSNFSSGKMAASIATALYLRGADVCYITTADISTLPKEIYTIEIDSAGEMYEYTIDAVRVAKKGKMSTASMNNTNAPYMIMKQPYLFMVAAVADFTPKYPQKGKLKKASIGEEWNISLKETADVLQSVNKDNLITIGFKAEMDGEKGLEHATDALHSKGVDAICYNLLQDSSSFGTTTNAITFITKENQLNLPQKSKMELAFELLDESVKLETKS
ncbi:MAG: bifunctional phosphopantothenoylcysteine decarboxylase/phosphopantothenate--cysteine ligase CoaBC [Campylobacterales bacterium]|nr:bifunctional phosphopantothenoylcysteine decarboxylase/phosphopantothenate--cysteine ligase CoaBC [Campylobacterales bacterium]